MAFLRALLFLFPLLFALLTGSCALKKSSVLLRKYPAEQLKKDAEVFRDVSMAMHPAIGIYQSRIYYENLFNGFIDALKDSLTERAFRIKVKLIADELHCGHTEILYSKTYYKEIKKVSANFSPYYFIPVQNKLYVLTNLNKRADSTLKRGTEIIQINGITVDSMLRYSKRFISSDGFNETAKDHYIQRGFNSYMVGLFGRPDTFEVIYKDGDRLSEHRYPAFRPKGLPSLPTAKKDDSLFKSIKAAALKYRYVDTAKKNMLVRIEKFSHRRYACAYRKVFRQLKNNKSSSLILDLRNNGGGSLANAYSLLSYLIDTVQTQTLRTCVKNYPYRQYTRGNLWFKFTRFAYTVIGSKHSSENIDSFVYTIKPRKRNHFKGNIVVLINGGSFSATSMVAAYLKERKKVAFIGQETGGAREGCNAGITPYYKLPNTKLRIRMPAFRIVHDVCNTITGQGIIPDYTTEYSLKDILSRRDLEFIKAKELLKIP
jgi:hypothetical protein